MTEFRIFDLPIQVAADYYTTSKQYYAMKMNSDGYAELAGASPEALIGVLQNKTKQYEAGAIRNIGVTKIVAGGTFDAGDKLTSDSASKAVEAAAGEKYFGVAREAGVTGRVVSMIMEFGHVAV